MLASRQMDPESLRRRPYREHADVGAVVQDERCHVDERAVAGSARLLDLGGREIHEPVVLTARIPGPKDDAQFQPFSDEPRTEWISGRKYARNAAKSAIVSSSLAYWETSAPRCVASISSMRSWRLE